jgi:hypothetical protein
MDIISSLINLAALALMCGVSVAGLAVILAIVAARMPPDNPLRKVLHALCTRLVAMLGVGAVAIPLQPIPGLDAIYDVGAIGVAAYLAYTFFRELNVIWKQTHQAPAVPAGRIDCRQEPVAQQRLAAHDGKQLRSDETRRLGR